MSDSPLGRRILQHLVDISLSKCTITDEEIVAEPDETTRDVLAALLMMYEELEYREHQRQQTLAQVTELMTNLEQRVTMQAQAILVLSTPVIEVVPGILVLSLSASTKDAMIGFSPAAEETSRVVSKYLTEKRLRCPALEMPPRRIEV